MRWSTGALIGAAVLAFAGGCGTAPNGGPPGTPQPGQSIPGPGLNSPTPVPNGPNVQEALDTANREFELLAKGDWAGAWALWTEDAKKEVPRQEFEKVNKACPTGKGEQIQLQDVKPVSMQLVELTWRQGETVGQSALRLVGAKWQYEPSGAILSEYASGPDSAITKRRSANKCPSA